MIARELVENRHKHRKELVKMKIQSLQGLDLQNDGIRKLISRSVMTDLIYCVNDSFKYSSEWFYPPNLKLDVQKSQEKIRSKKMQYENDLSAYFEVKLSDPFDSWKDGARFVMMLGTFTFAGYMINQSNQNLMAGGVGLASIGFGLSLIVKNIYTKLIRRQAYREFNEIMSKFPLYFDSEHQEYLNNRLKENVPMPEYYRRSLSKELRKIDESIAHETEMVENLTIIIQEADDISDLSFMGRFSERLKDLKSAESINGILDYIDNRELSHEAMTAHVDGLLSNVREGKTHIYRLINLLEDLAEGRERSLF